MDQKKLRKIEQAIGYKFSNQRLLRRAFTHSSSVDNRILSNERLEFFGDSILALVICESLYEKFPGSLEGDLTKAKSMLVARRTCARVAKHLGLVAFLNIGKGMAGSRALTGSLAAGLLEAIIAVIYIDGGLQAARAFILRNFFPFIEQANVEHLQGNYKSMLQQYAQQQFNITPLYELVDEKGPDHDKCFEAEVVIAGRRFPGAWGTNKKEAEQKAAFNALVELGITGPKD
ncbi:MAG: ribonuclease III [Sedimentisphaerales bacterium]|nr:ribonuclease III [Sedimentisphaerales bacterium]